MEFQIKDRVEHATGTRGIGTIVAVTNDFGRRGYRIRFDDGALVKMGPAALRPAPCTCVVTGIEDTGDGESGPRPHPIYDQDSVETCPVHGRAGDPEAWSLIDAMDRQEAEYRAGLSPEGLARYLAWCEGDEETNR